MFQFRAIDPMALILSEKAYLIWVEIHHPHEPALAALEKVFQSLPAEEQRATLNRAKAVGAWAKAVETAAAQKVSAKRA